MTNFFKIIIFDKNIYEMYNFVRKSMNFVYEITNKKEYFEYIFIENINGGICNYGVYKRYDF